MPLHIPALIPVTEVYTKVGTSGTAVALLTEQSIPEMEETINAKAGDTFMISFDCIRDYGPGHDLIRGQIPSVSGWVVEPGDLENITDGDDTTSTTTGEASGIEQGYLDWDLGSKQAVTYRAYVGLWRSGGTNVRVYVYGSDNGIDWTSIEYTTTTSTSEVKPVLSGEASYRYFRLRLIPFGGAIGYAKFYTFEIKKGRASLVPYIAFWPEVNGEEIVPRGKNFLDYAPLQLSLIRVYEVPSDGDYIIEIKWQEFPLAEGLEPYESSCEISENQRSLIIQHIESL